MKKSFLNLLSIILSFSPLILSGQNSVNGYVLYNSNFEQPIAGATVTISSLNHNVVSQTTTDINGYYNFSSIPAGDYLIDVAYDGAAGGVTLEDAYIVLEYIHGTTELTELQQKAADVDFNGIINYNDVVGIIQKYIMQLLNFNKKWVFETIEINVGNNNKIEDGGETVRGSCSGDVNGSYSPPQMKTDKPDLLLKCENTLNISPNQLITVPVKFADVVDNIKGLGLILDYSSEFINIQSIDFVNPSFTYNIVDGQIRISWIDKNLNPLSLNPDEIFAKINLSLKPNMHINQKIFEFTLNQESEIVYNSKNIPVINIPKLELSGNNNFIIYPNPSIDKSNIVFELSEEGNVTFNIYDLSGRKVSEIYNANLQAGLHQINFVTSYLENGNYLINFEFKGKDNKFLSYMQKLLIAR